MSDYLKSLRVQVGIALLLFGSGPLFFIMIAAALGQWPDANPNRIGPGFLAFLTFWPGVLCIGTGIQRMRRGANAVNRPSMIVSDRSGW